MSDEPTTEPVPTKEAFEREFKGVMDKLKHDHVDTIKGLRTKVSDAENRAKLATERADKLTKENKKIRESVDPLKENLSANGKALIEIGRKVERLQSEIDATKKERETAHRRFTQLEGSAVLMQKARENAQANLGNAEKARLEAEVQRDAARVEVSDLRDKIKDLEKILKDAKVTASQTTAPKG